MRKRPVSVPIAKGASHPGLQRVQSGVAEERPQQQQQIQLLLDKASTLGFNVDLQQAQPCVTRVQKGSGAAAAGVRKGDLLVSVDGILLKVTNRMRIADKLREPIRRPLKVVLARPAVITLSDPPHTRPMMHRSSSGICANAVICVQRNFETVPAVDTVSSDSDPRSVRNLLVEAVEDNDVEELRTLITMAVACGVDNVEITNAERHLDFLDQKAAWIEKWGCGLPDCRPAAARRSCELQPAASNAEESIAVANERANRPQEQLESVQNGLQEKLETMQARLAEQEARCRAAEEDRACLQKELAAVQSQLVDQRELRSELEACLEERSELQSELTELRLQFPCGTGVLGMAEVVQDDACSVTSPLKSFQSNSFRAPSLDLEGTCSNSSVLREFLHDEICLEEATLGTGASGTVCRAQLMVDGQDRTVAVKQFGADNDAFLKESKYLAKVHHPNIVQVFGQLTMEEGPCLVLELLRKPDWGSPALQPAKALRDILQGVAYIHEHQAVHLDIKPDNVMQGFDMDVSAPLKLIDFSIAASTEQSCHGFMGSLPFAAPELLSESPWWGAPADVFSVGAILVLLLEIKLLFQHLGWAKDIRIDDRSERRHALPTLSQAWDSLAAELPAGDGKDICCKLLNLMPEDRLTATEALRCPWLSV